MLRIIIPLLFISISIRAQELTHRGDFRLVFYNVENLFDTVDDAPYQDDEFAAGGVRAWSKLKLSDKCMRISKVCVDIGGWKLPEIISLAEVENLSVIKMLAYGSVLNKGGYNIIHKDSQDPRGIDVALLYRRKYFKELSRRFIKQVPVNAERRSRDILYVKGIALGIDTLHLFVNHWPSRWGGEFNSQHKRNFAASCLSIAIDSINLKDPQSKIVIMGDFNDHPHGESLIDHLLYSNSSLNIIGQQLFNLSYKFDSRPNKGSHKYEYSWGVVDQFIVSEALIITNKGLFCNLNSMNIFNPRYLLEIDNKYMGLKPKRTFIGFKYQNGFSDHLPIFMDLNIK